MGERICSVDGCAKVARARGWCSTHWARWNKHGDPEARRPGEVRNGCRICPGCGVDKPLSDWGKAVRDRCKACQALRTAAYRLRNPYKPVEGKPAECDSCGQVFMANGRRRRYCSRECFEAFKHRANWKHYQARRARLQAVLVEVFDRREVLERDGWICQICMSPVDRDAPWPDPRSPSIDHIVPISRGGVHSRANTQAACLGCNVRKGARLIA